MSDQTGDEKFQPPYMAWTTFENILETLGSKGLPDQIDRSLLTNRSGGDQAQFLRAARAFGLIDAQGRPLDRFKTYIAEPEKRREILREILAEAYPTVLALPSGATPSQLDGAFRAFGIEGDTVRKAETFFLNAARQAEIDLSPHFKSTRPGTGAKRRSPRATRTKANGEDENNGQVTAPALHPAIQTLVQALPSFADDGSKPVFPQAERDAWFAYASATFNLIYALPTLDGSGDS